MTEFASQFNARLESLRLSQCADVFHRIALSGVSSHDLQPDDVLFVVNVQFGTNEWRGFWFVEANAIVELVNETETRDYYTSPTETLIILDRCSPDRIVETLARYFEQCN